MHGLKDATMEKNVPLYLQMKEYLLALIQQNRNVPHYKLPSENQLAIRFNASRIASKHAFDVLEEQGLIYRQRGRGTFINPHAQSEVPASLPASHAAESRTIALIVPFICTMFMSDIIDAVRHKLVELGLEMVVFVTDSDQEREINYLRIAQESCRGALLFPGDFARYHEDILRLVLNHFPIVLIDRYLPGLNLSYVACDHQEATSRAVDFLHQKGHRRIGCIGHMLGHASSVAERFRGFDIAMQKYDPSYPNSFKLNVKDTLENFDERFTDYLLAVRPTAIISSSHLHAPHIIKILRAMNMADQVDLMLFDNEFSIAKDFMAYHPYIIDQQPQLIGATAAQLVHDLAFAQKAPTSIKVKANIIQI